MKKYLVGGAGPAAVARPTTTYAYACRANETVLSAAQAAAAEARAEAQAEARAEASKLRDEASKLRDLLALQRRLEALHSAKLLGDKELYAIEDTIADGTAGGGQVAALLSLSATMAADGAFARQARRKYL